jgi:acetyl esterase
MAQRIRDRIRSRVGSAIVDNGFRALARVGRLHPLARPERHNVEVIADLQYRESGLADHRLDIYRPRDANGGLPVVLYVHGGGFRILSKDTHWLMGLAFARRGFLVCNINYRLAPQSPFPAAIEDTCAAFEWIAGNASRYGGDLSRLVFAGESAGANLVAALTIATNFVRPEPFAQRAFAVGVTPRAVVPACGMFQVSDVARFSRRKPLPAWVQDRLDEVSRAYLHDVRPDGPRALDLANPLTLLERDDAPARPLPPFFLPVGTADPLLDDTRRLAAALARRGVSVEARYYKGEVHAFHAMVFRSQARLCWQESFAFIDRHLPSNP